MTLRRGIFWTHLVAGLVCGVIIALMAVTGVVYAFQPQILSWARRDVARVEVPADAARKSVDELAAAVRTAFPAATPSGITISADPAEAVVVAQGRGKPSLYVNPYTAEVREDSAGAIGEFLAFNLRLHRWLALGGESRDVGKAITGFCSAAFLVLSLTGLYVWWPRRWTRRALRPSLLINTKARGKARDWNWHNVLGFWSLPLLITLSATGMMMSYRWAGNLLYLVAGETPPPAPAPAPAGAPGGARPAEGAPRAEGQARREGGAPAGGQQQGGPRIAPPSPDAKPLSQQKLFEIASGEYSEWSTVTVRIPSVNTNRPASAVGGESRREGGERPRAERATGGESEARPTAGESRRPRGEGESRPRREGAAERVAGEVKAVVDDAVGTTERPRRARQESAASGQPAASVSVRRGDRLPISANVSLTLNPYTGEVIKQEGFEDKTLGARMRGSVKGVHTGEAFGLFGQFLMFCGSIVTLILVYTGFALSWRRFFPKKKKHAGSAHVSAE